MYMFLSKSFFFCFQLVSSLAMLLWLFFFYIHSAIFKSIISHITNPEIFLFHFTILLLLFICSHSLFRPYLLISLDLKDGILCAFHLAMFWEFHMGILYLYYFQSFFSPHLLLRPSLTIPPQAHDLITYSFLIVMCARKTYILTHTYVYINSSLKSLFSVVYLCIYLRLTT